MKKTIPVALLLLFSLISVTVKSQLVITEQMVNRSKNNLGNIELDNSLISVYYQFIQQVEIDNKTAFLTDTTLLEVGNTYSLYYNISSRWRDSIYSKHASAITQDMVKEVSVIRDAREFESLLGQNTGGINYERDENRDNTLIYKNRGTNIISSVNGNYKETFLCEELILPADWAFLPDTMSILNYQCHKAETTFRGRNYTAWFTIDIPINEGPWKLYGLPGLILKLEDDEQIFSYEAVGLMHNSGKLITMSDDTYTKCSNEQLYKWIENKRKNVSRTIYSNGVMYVSQRPNRISFQKQELVE